MSGDFGNDFVTVTDDDGNEYELEHLDTLEWNGELYMAFAPFDIEEDDEEYGLVILKVQKEDDEDILISVDDEDELDAVFSLFIDRMPTDGEDGEDADGEYEDGDSDSAE